MAEHLTFNQGVRSSNLRWDTNFIDSYSNFIILALTFNQITFIKSLVIWRIPEWLGTRLEILGGVTAYRVRFPGPPPYVDSSPIGRDTGL